MPTMLCEREKLQNQQILENLFLIIRESANSAAVSTREKALRDLILKFSEENNITLTFLLANEQQHLDEEARLIAIMKVALEKEIEDEVVQQEVEAKLLVWKKHLYHAVYGQGAQVRAHTGQVSGMASELLNKGEVSIKQWGTDLDVLQCLASDITDFKKIQPAEIFRSAGHILSPVSLTESSEPLFDHLQLALQKVTENHINEKVSLSIPVNCNNSHWRLAKVIIENQKITKAKLWDSLSGDVEDLKKTSSHKSFQAAVNKAAGNDHVKVGAKLAGVQENPYSCMDFTIQKAYGDKKMNNAITNAGKNPKKLREAVVKQIVTHNANLGSAVANVLVFDQAKEKIINPQFVTADQKQAASDDKNIFKQLGVNQVEFDEKFARKLQSMYDESPCESDEKKLVNLAYQDTYSFFKAKTPTSHSTDESVLDDCFKRII